MKRLIMIVLLLPCLAGFAKERKQWTEKQAWDWEKKVGTIIGFNQPESAYPGMTNLEILSKASDLGFNSVRFWLKGEDVDAQIAYIKKMADEAKSCGMTISPVLSLQRKYFNDKENEKENLKIVEELVKTLIRPFANDERIVLWDIWNEPGFKTGDPETFREMEWVEKMVHWCREENLCQPITASIIWDPDRDADVSSPTWEKRRQVEAMMDLHNFHSYDCARNFGAEIDYTLDRIRKISNRPIVCTEAMIRVNGSSVQRTLPVFAREHVHVYLWGLYNNDWNWSVKWGRSTYDAFDPMFHDFLWADGDAYDAREFPFIKNFRFWNKGENLDPGIAVTDRWSHERVWRRMAGAGLVKGLADVKSSGSFSGTYNSMRVKVNYKDYRGLASDQRSGFFERFERILSDAKSKGMTVLPVLITDDDLYATSEELGGFVKEMISRYYDDQTILAWDIYWHPGEKSTDRRKVEEVIETAFTYARNQYPNQPVFMTPFVSVQEFDDDFNYRAALVHGRRNGWNKLSYGGTSDADLVYKIWSLSDVTSFSTVQHPAEAGWLLSICYRFGRPIFCSSFKAENVTDQLEMLDLFSKSHVFWFTENPLPDKSVNQFKFTPIITKH
ncbi:MAG: hypothetical protein II632_08335 [Bacteroidales bacterium]|nr:hypothetical protein [Bacteroidales bacterium]